MADFCSRLHIIIYCLYLTVSVPDVPATEKSKSKQELSRNEHLAALKHEGELHNFFPYIIMNL